MDKLDRLYKSIVEYYAGDAGRIQHLVKVHSFSAYIGRAEGLPADQLVILEAAALVHDIGIRPAMEIYGSSSGVYQEQLGREPARKMALECGFDPEAAERIAYLVGHHHTYDSIDGMDYRILVEADFLVNLYEANKPEQAVLSAYNRIFRTETGRRLCRVMFGIKE